MRARCIPPRPMPEIQRIGSLETAPALSSYRTWTGARRGRDNKASLESFFRWVDSCEDPGPPWSTAEREPGPRESATRKPHGGAKRRQLIAVDVRGGNDQ